MSLPAEQPETNAAIPNATTHEPRNGFIDSYRTEAVAFFPVTMVIWCQRCQSESSLRIHHVICTVMQMMTGRGAQVASIEACDVRIVDPDKVATTREQLPSTAETDRLADWFKVLGDATRAASRRGPLGHAARLTPRALGPLWTLADKRELRHV